MNIGRTEELPEEPEMVLPALRGMIRMRLHEIDPKRPTPDELIDDLANGLSEGGCVTVWSR